MSFYKVDEYLERMRHQKYFDYYGVNVFYGKKGLGCNAQILPVYCGSCGKTLSNFYVNDGSSRYGQNATIICDYCRSEIWVTDHDHGVLNDIKYNNIWYDFDEIYQINSTVTKKLIDKYQLDFNSFIPESTYRDVLNGVIRLDDLSEKIIEVAQLDMRSNLAWKVPEKIERAPFSNIPYVARRWIHILELCDI